MSATIEDLLALYVNGQATPDERAAVETAVAADAELAARLAFLESVADAARADGAEAWSPGAAGFQRLMDEIAEEHGATPMRRTRRWPRALAPLTAAAAALAVGLFVGAFSDALWRPDASPPGWRMSAAIYQRLYTAETFDLAPQPAAERVEGWARLAARVGLDASRLAAPEGLALQRADLLEFEGRLLGQIAFLSAEDAPISLCVMRRVASDRIADSPTPVRLLDDVNGVEWATSEHVFLLVGKASPDTLKSYADRFAADFS